MIITMDGAGRLVIPKEIREKAGLKPEQPLEIRCHDGRVEIEPAAIKVKMVRKGPLLVALPEHPVDPLTPEVVEETRRAILRGRGVRD